jgi:flagellar hook-length control protein FliK
MSEEFKGILDVVNELTNQLFEETGISFIEVKDIVISYASQEMIDVDVPKEESLTQVNPEEVLEVAEELPEEPVAIQVETTIVKPEESTENTKTVSEDAEPSQQITLKENVDAKQFDSEDSSFEQPNAKTQENVVLKQTTKPSEPIIRNDGMVFGEPRIEIQFSPEEQLVSLPTGQTVSSEEIVNQLVEQARILNEAESTTMEMTLNPEGLGKIFMEVTQKGDEITARIFTENDAVKQALESQMANLRVEMNQNSSTKVTSIEVSVGTHEFEKNLEEDAQNEQRRDEQANQSERRSNRINLNSMDDLTGLMSEEDILIAQMMKDNGNTLDFQA